MKRKKIIVGRIGFIAIGLFLLSLYLKETFQYAFFNREQQQLFLFDSDYVSGLLLQPGGVALCLSRFLVQFFYSTVWSVSLTALLLLSIILASMGILRKLGGKWFLAPLAFCPAGTLILSLFDPCFFYEVLIAYAMAMVGLYLYLSTARETLRMRLCLGGAIAFILFGLAGAVASLFACCAFCCDLAGKSKKSLCSLSYVPFTLLLAWGAVRSGVMAQMERGCTSANYYEWTLEMPVFHHISWVALLLLPFGVVVGRMSLLHGKWLQRIVFLLLLTSEIGLFSFLQDRRMNQVRVSFEQYRYEYYTVMKQWKDLQREASKRIMHYHDANYLNLSLAEQGVLLDHLFTYPQYGPQSLVYIPNNKSADVRLAHLWFAMGNIAAAQNVAFNSLFALNGYNPTMLQMLVRIELMRGNYLVALKYITLLEKTVHYAGWATAQRRFLFDDEAVEQDPSLGTGRASFPLDDSFVLLASPMDDLYKIVAVNPANSNAMQYALAYLLLAKDFNHVQSFVDTYYGTPALQYLAEPVQEALLFFSDYYHTLEEDYALRHGISNEQLSAYQQVDWEYCKAHGVESSTLDRFVQFKKGYEQVRQGAPRSLLDGFKHTFWYYLLFAEIG